jgi:hypothetical protein
MKNYESACWHGGNFSYFVATKWVLFPKLLSLVSNQFLVENLCNYMKKWLQYVLFGGHQMGFVPQHVEFGVKFSFLLKIYAIT